MVKDMNKITLHILWD